MKMLFTCPLCQDLLQEPVKCSGCTGVICNICRMQLSNNHTANHGHNETLGSKVNYQTKRDSIPKDDILECALCRIKTVCQPSQETRKFLDTLKFHCKQRDQGCDIQSAYSSLFEYVKSCSFRRTYEQLEELIDTQQIKIESLTAELDKTNAQLKEEQNENSRLNK